MDIRYRNTRRAPPIRFSYRSRQGAISEHTLLYWQENSLAVQGREHTGAFASFHKVCMVRVHGGGEWLNQAQVPPAPDPLARLAGGFSPRIFFFGFTAAERLRLELLAAEKGLHVLPKLPKALEFCCCGMRVRWRELQQAFDRNAWVLHPQQLMIALETGVLPEHHPWLF